MGIDVVGKIVTYNPAHQQRVVTDSTLPPPRCQLGDLQMVSIFRRKAAKRGDSDGNPLIHALKGKKGYVIAAQDFREILKCARTILPMAVESLDYDLVVPLPSSSKVAAMLAVRVARARDSCAITHCFDKASFGQVLDSTPPIDAIERRWRRGYKAQLAALQRADPTDIFEMKQVDKALRGYFTPLVPNMLAATAQGRRVLLVDDILGSGASMRAAQNALAAFGPTSVTGLTLMGMLET